MSSKAGVLSPTLCDHMSSLRFLVEFMLLKLLSFLCCAFCSVCHRSMCCAIVSRIYGLSIRNYIFGFLQRYLVDYRIMHCNIYTYIINARLQCLFSSMHINDVIFCPVLLSETVPASHVVPVVLCYFYYKPNDKPNGTYPWSLWDRYSKS